MKSYIIFFISFIVLASFGCRDESEDNNLQKLLIMGNRSQWTKFRGGADDDYAKAVAVDSSNNIYIAGYTENSIDGQALSGGYDACIMKYDAGGTHLWTRLRGGSTYDYATDIAVDAAGNVYITGYTSSSIDGQTYSGNHDVFVMKFNSNGTHQWTRLRGGTLDDYGDAIAVDSTGNVFIAGYTYASLDGQTFGGGLTDAFVIKYDTNGTHQWTRLRGGTGLDNVHDIIIHSNYIYVAGGTTEGFDGYTVNGSNDIFIIMYETNGDHVDTKIYGGFGSESVAGIAADSQGNIFIAGETDNSLDWQVYSGGFNDAFLIKYNSFGMHQWTKLRGSSGNDKINDIAVDSAGNVYMIGNTNTAFDNQIYNGGDFDALLIKYDTNGNHLQTKFIGGSGDDYGFGIDVDSAGNVCVTGYTNDGFNRQSVAGDRDIFIRKN